MTTDFQARRLALWLGVLLLVLSSAPQGLIGPRTVLAQEATPTATNTPAVPFKGDYPVIAAAGDIACGAASKDASCQEMRTAGLVQDINPDAVLPLGDVQYECGELSDFQSYYDPSWGRFNDIAFPVIGNHEYRNNDEQEEGKDCIGLEVGAPGYYDYFDGRGNPLNPDCIESCQGYYSWNIGEWHMIALNDQCQRIGAEGCLLGTPQMQWLLADLTANQFECTLVYQHSPRYSSGRHGDNEDVTQFWEAIYAAGADVVLAGHDHHYERFTRMDPYGGPDPDHGIRSFVIGTGGRNLTAIAPEDLVAGSEVLDDKTYGVLEMTLKPGSYDWAFRPVTEYGNEDEAFTDSGSDTCVGPTDAKALARLVERSNEAARSLAEKPGSMTDAGITAGGSAGTLAPSELGDPILRADFSDGNLDAWTDATGLSIEPGGGRDGRDALIAACDGEPCFGRQWLDYGASELVARVGFRIDEQGDSPVSLFRLRSQDSGSIIGVHITPSGRLGVRNDQAKESVAGSEVVSLNEWHDLVVHMRIDGESGWLDVWLDGEYIQSLSGRNSFGGSPVDRLQIGGSEPNRSFKVRFDVIEVGVGAERAASETLVPLLEDGFEDGTFDQWGRASGLVIQSAEVDSGMMAARSSGDPGAAYARQDLRRPVTSISFRINVNVLEVPTSSLTLMRLRDVDGESIVSVTVESGGLLTVRNSVTGDRATSSISLPPGTWHEVILIVNIKGPESAIGLWYDGQEVTVISRTTELGTNPVAQVQLGDTNKDHQTSVIYDDVLIAENGASPTE